MGPIGGWKVIAWFSRSFNRVELNEKEKALTLGSEVRGAHTFDGCNRIYSHLSALFYVLTAGWDPLGRKNMFWII